MTIEKQKKVADNVLDKLKHFDPTAIVAGGAPRDWYFGKEASDIDVFFYVRGDLPTSWISDILEEMGFVTHRVNTGEGLPDIYKKNPHLRAVFDCTVDGVDVQLLLMHKPTFVSVIPEFPLNICGAWYKYGEIRTTKGFDRAVKHKAIVKVNTLYANEDAYIQKIKSKFPDFKYYPSYEKLAESLLDA